MRRPASSRRYAACWLKTFEMPHLCGLRKPPWHGSTVFGRPRKTPEDTPGRPSARSLRRTSMSSRGFVRSSATWHKTWMLLGLRPQRRCGRSAFAGVAWGSNMVLRFFYRFHIMILWFDIMVLWFLGLFWFKMGAFDLFLVFCQGLLKGGHSYR